MADLDVLIERNDPDPLLRYVDELCRTRNWQALVDTRDRCNAATERGKTLWGVAEHVNYRLALEASGEYAALAVDTEPGPLALGPLTEVAASTHEWAELEPHLTEGPSRGLTAYECVVRGEDLSGDESLYLQREAFGMPMRLCEWEPEYPKPVYNEHDAQFPPPVIATTMHETASAPSRIRHRQDADTERAWHDLVAPWLTSSNGTLSFAAVTGGPGDAVFALSDDEIDIEQAIAMSRIDSHTALQWMCWVASSGGVYGRRRGSALGRSLSWWAMATACGFENDGDMPDPADIEEGLQEIAWWTWGNTDLSTGWSIRLVAHDITDNVAFAISASDRADQTPAGQTPTPTINRPS